MSVNILYLPLQFCSRPKLGDQLPLHGSLPGNGTRIARRFRCVMSAETPSLSDERRSANFQPNMWSYDYLQSLENDLEVDQTYKHKANLLEEEVRSMINDEKADFFTTVELVNSLQRLGLSYCFQGDIRSALNRFVSLGGLEAQRQKSLHDTALCFRILRQNGYVVSQDVFNKFKDQQGNFKESLQEDIEGMLSLYEASHLTMEGECLLDKAKAFTRSHLKDIKLEDIGSAMAEEVAHALELPLHHRIERQEARWSIEACIRREEVNQALLKLAILDFNLVQSDYQREIRYLSRWWRGVGIAKKLSFSRDRMMESFFWAIGINSLPQFTSCRRGIAKLAQLITTIDDVYDVYSTLEELELFTDAVERWDIRAVENLPDYMKLCFLALYNTINDMIFEILKEHEENAIPYLTKAWTDLCKSFFQESKWAYNKSTPPFEEYIENAWRTSSGGVLLVHAYFLLGGQGYSKQELDFLEDYHELLHLPSLILRFYNDLATSSVEIARGETANAMSCYMKEIGVTEEAARNHINKLIDEAWKKMNKYQVKWTPFSRFFAETAINLARISRLIYYHGDRHSAPDARSKNIIRSLIIEPIPMMKHE